MPEAVDISAALAHIEAPPIAPASVADKVEKAVQGVALHARLKRMDKPSRERRRMLMAAMYAKGRTQDDIGKHFHVSQSVVCDELDQLVAEFRAAGLKSISEKVAQDEAMISFVLIEACEAWFESKRGKRINVKKRAREILLKAPNDKNTRGKRHAKPPKRIAMAPAQADLSLPEDDLAVFDDPEALSERLDDTARQESSPGEGKFLSIILECIKFRGLLYGYFKRGGPGEGGIASNQDDENYQDWTPAQRLTRLNSMVENARVREGQQRMLRQAQLEYPVAAAQGNGHKVSSGQEGRRLAAPARVVMAREQVRETVARMNGKPLAHKPHEIDEEF